MLDFAVYLGTWINLAAVNWIRMNRSPRQCSCCSFGVTAWQPQAADSGSDGWIRKFLTQAINMRRLFLVVQNKIQQTQNRCNVTRPICAQICAHAVWELAQWRQAASIARSNFRMRSFRCSSSSLGRHMKWNPNDLLAVKRPSEHCTVSSESVAIIG